MKPDLTPESIIEIREYQEIILKKLQANFLNHPRYHTIVEVDTGLGKRVLTYLLIKKILSTEKILLLLHSTTSYSETVHYFKSIYGGFQNSDFQAFSSKSPGWLRSKILKNTRIIATTPQTFSNAFNKMKTKPKFDVVIINEVDKIVRRQGGIRVLIFPYNNLIPFFINHGSWIVGMTGTMRDSHILYNYKKDTFEVQHEIVTLDKKIPELHVIKMDTLLAQTDIKKYIKNTYIKQYPVTPDLALCKILELIDNAIKTLRETIIEETLEKRPTLLDTIPSSQLALVTSMLDSTGQSQKYQGLLLVRKYCTAMQKEKFRRFLYRLKNFGITKEIIHSLPNLNKKIEAIKFLVQKQSPESKTVILCSFLDTADVIQKTVKNIGVTTFLITGQVRNKGDVLNDFKSSEGKSVLVMTSVGERDIDIPQAKLLIVYDSINTVKTMYQRMKRTRGGLVLCLYYEKTFEERKVIRLLQEISERYPWSSIITDNSF
ncbi:MAG: helicase-related protein [Candidatus Hodarchaeales archaeon]